MHRTRSIPQGRAQFGHRRRVEALRDDHAIIVPMLHDHRALFRRDLRHRDRTVHFPNKPAPPARSRCDSAVTLHPHRSAQTARLLAPSSIAKRTTAPSLPCWPKPPSAPYPSAGMSRTLHPAMPKKAHPQSSVRHTASTARAHPVRQFRPSRTRHTGCPALPHVRDAHRRQLLTLDVSLGLQHFVRVPRRTRERPRKSHLLPAFVQQFAFEDQTSVDRQTFPPRAGSSAHRA